MHALVIKDVPLSRVDDSANNSFVGNGMRIPSVHPGASPDAIILCLFLKNSSQPRGEAPTSFTSPPPPPSNSCRVCIPGTVSALCFLPSTSPSSTSLHDIPTSRHPDKTYLHPRTSSPAPVDTHAHIRTSVRARLCPFASTSFILLDSRPRPACARGCPRVIAIE
jgi:hypothetical protein